MLRRVSRYQILVILILLQGSLGYSQMIRLQQSGNRQVLIGEPVTLSWQVLLPASADTSQTFAWRSDAFSGFELLDQQPRQLTHLNDQGWLLQQQFRFVSFDSGRHSIPFPVLSPDTLQASPDSVYMEVRFDAADSADQRIHDIQAVYEVTDSGWNIEVILLLFAGFVMLIGILFFYWKRRRRKIPVLVPETKLHSFETIWETLRLLELQVQQSGLEAAYLVQLKQLLKQYLEGRGIPGIPAMVTSDLLLKCRQNGLDAVQLGKLASVLRMADAVQFARYQPDITDWKRMLDYLRSCLNELHQRSYAPQSENPAHGV